ncbi:MAG: response regulator [Lentisphaerota bacterium]
MNIHPTAPAFLKLLLVDDDPSFRDAIQRMVRGLKIQEACEILQAANGKESIELLREHHPDCMLLDYQMPGGDGLHWLREILEIRPDLAVIMITGVGSEEVAVEAMKTGATDYLVKGSITPEALHRVLANAIERNRMLKIIQEQKEELLNAERHRVMIESLAAACHHLGQPSTVILNYLELMNQKEKSPEIRAMLQECLQAAEAIADILHRLQIVGQYRTVPYLPSAGQSESQWMLDI